MAKQHYNITVTGKVQGVSYRAITKAVADMLFVKGSVRNQADGSVYIEAEADPKLMEQFLEWCAEGPDSARVETVEKVEGVVEDFTNFVIKK